MRSFSTHIATVDETMVRWINDHAGVSVDVIGAGSTAVLLECFPAPASGGRPALILRSIATPDTLPDGPRALGWSIETADAYTTAHTDAADIPGNIVGSFRVEHYDVAVLTASSQARVLVPLLGLPSPSTQVVTVGAPTAITANRQRTAAATQASPPTPDAIVRALIGALSRPAQAGTPEERGS